jgi:beta-xylosidase
MARTALVAVIAIYGVKAATYTNPVCKDSTPDPGVMFDETSGRFLAASTGVYGNNYFPIHSSDDLVSWSLEGFVFPNATGPPAWTNGAGGFFWAPELHKLPTGSYVAVYAAQRKGNSAPEHSIGVAHASTPSGPWTDLGAPLLTHPKPVGLIDATIFVDPQSNRVYLVYKVDNNAIHELTVIEAVELDAGATKVLSSSPWQLLATSEEWEGPLVEAPWVVFRGGSYYLFYSGNIMANYAVGVARSSSIESTNWTKHPGPVISANNATGWDLVGPGHCSVLQLPTSPPGEGSWMMWLHTWAGHQQQYNFSQPRRLTQVPVEWNETTGWPVVDGGRPPIGPQPVPPFSTGTD